MLRQLNQNIFRILKTGLFLTFITVVQIVIIQVFGEKSFYILIGLNLMIYIAFFFWERLEGLAGIVLVLNFLFLLYFDIEFHYLMKNVFLQDLTLFIILLYGFTVYLASEKDFSFQLTYIKKAILLFIGFQIIALIVGKINGNQSSVIVNDFYHISYYVLPLFFAYIFQTDEAYFTIGIFIVIIFTLISLYHIYVNLFTPTIRFVMFQMYITPLIVGVLFSIVLIYKKNRMIRLFSFASLSIISFAILVTLTRTLWVSFFITSSVVYMIYLVYVRKKSKYTISFLAAILIITIVFLGISVASKKTTNYDINDVEYRTQSLANPSEDKSLLMRLELGYYIYQKLSASPIWGTGLGDVVKYKILNIDKDAVIYPDSSWLYFLWKSGIVGLLLYIWLYYRILYLSNLIFKKSDNELIKAIALGLFAGFIGLALLGLLNAVLIKYKTGVILAFAIAFLDFIDKKYDILSES